VNAPGREAYRFSPARICSVRNNRAEYAAGRVRSASSPLPAMVRTGRCPSIMVMEVSSEKEGPRTAKAVAE